MIIFRVSIFLLWIPFGDCFYHSCPATCYCPRAEEAVCQFSDDDREIPRDEFSPKLIDLKINGGRFEEINANTFDHLPNLKRLQLTRNKIQRIGPFAFGNLPNLKLLIVQFNPLNFLDHNSFGGIVSGLDELVLTQNSIGLIKSHAFNGTKKIRQLDLRDNPVTTIESLAFAHLSQVGYFRLPYHVTYIEPGAFDGLHGVHFFDLKYWKAQKSDEEGVYPGIFQGLSDVTSLLIENSDLGVLYPKCFEGLSKIGVLAIKKCEILEIKRKSFLGLVEVGRFEMTENLIWNLEQNSVRQFLQPQFFNNNTQLSISDNNFDCTCHNLWMIHFFDKIDPKILDTNFCMVPQNLKNKKLSSIDLDSVENCSSASLGKLPNDLKFDYYDLPAQPKSANHVAHLHISHLFLYFIFKKLFT